MRGGVVLCSVLSVEAARRGRLLHGKVEVCLVLLAQDAMHRAVIRHPFVYVVLIWWPNGWLFFVVHVFPGGRGYLEYLDLYLQGSMSGDLGRQVVVLRLCHLDVCRVRVARSKWESAEPGFRGWCEGWPRREVVRSSRPMACMAICTAVSSGVCRPRDRSLTGLH